MKAMIQDNGTGVNVFILLGFAVHQEVQYVLFLVFLAIYMTSLGGNVGIIVLIKCDAHLHTPMYFFLQNLALVDLCYTSAITPKMLVNFLASDKSISFTGCVIQAYVYGTFVTIELYLLTAMAVDRYMAICNPLRYPIVMSKRACIQLVTGSYFVSSLTATIHTGFLFSLTFCNSNTINHFFCDTPPILALSCSNTDIFIMSLIILASFNLVGTLLVVFFSYIYILAAILRMSSAAGRHKAFSTCSSHLTAVSIFYGTLSYMYIQPSSTESQENDKVASVFYGIVIPMLNPLIYSLRNKEVKQAVKVLVKSCSGLRPCLPEE